MDRRFIITMEKSKKNSNVYCAVVDIDCGKKDLQQCADAVMRLRAEYLFSINRLDAIHFNDLPDNKPHYFIEFANGKTDYATFRRYFDYIFAYANTSSLCDELIPQKLENIEAGNVWVQKGKPFGHTVTVMDVAKDKNGSRIFLLSQSYMPAQDIHILINPTDARINPWFSTKDLEILLTPEWIFYLNDLKQF